MSHSIATDFRTLRQRFDLEEIASEHTTLNASSQGKCPFCGGRDRFYIHKGGQRWGCRKCTEKGGDVFDLIARIHNVPLGEAVKILTGDAKGINRAAPSRATSEQTPAPKVWESQRWQDEARAIAEMAETALMTGGPGADYLSSRGIRLATYAEFRVGFAERYGRPAIVLPWLDGQRRITAIKYRFIDDLGKTDRTRRYSQHAGSSGELFGVHRVNGGGPSKTIIAVEGEFNAVAIAQVARPQGYDVVSVGSEANSRGCKALKAPIAAHGHQRVLLWFDDGGRAQRAASGLRDAVLMQSPSGCDANDLLVRFGGKVLAGLIHARFASSDQSAPNPASWEPGTLDLSESVEWNSR